MGTQLFKKYLKKKLGNFGDMRLAEKIILKPDYVSVDFIYKNHDRNKSQWRNLINMTMIFQVS
jgi:hypothetical protein